MARSEWAGLNVAPGDRVTTAQFGTGVVGGSLYRGAAVPQVRLIRRGKGGPVVLGAGNLTIEASAPVYEVGQETPMGEVLERWEREDAPGFMYRVKIGETAEGEDRSTIVGPERLQTLS